MENAVKKLVVLGVGIEGEKSEFITALAKRLMGAALVSERKRGTDVVLIEATEEWADSDPRVVNYAEFDEAAAQYVLDQAARAEAARAEHARLFNKPQSAADRAMSAYLNGDERALGAGANRR